MKKDSRIYLARRIGAKENASVSWSGRSLVLTFTDRSTWAMLTPRLARLLAKRINQALDEA